MRTITTLLCHAHVDMALVCLGSLRSCLREPFRLRIHDDGTLDEGDRSRLTALGDLEFVDRREADLRVEPHLGRHPRCLAFRRGNPLALKLFDACLLAGEAQLCFCDSDVLFLRPVSGLFDAGAPGDSVFMRDEQNAYSLRSWQLARHRLRIPARINTGLFRFPRERFDLDLVEWYLGRPEMHFAPVWMEQTAWALLAGTGPCLNFDARRVGIAKREPPGDGCEVPIALHFVSSRRRLLPAWRSLAGPECRLESEMASLLRPAPLAVDEARRLWARVRASGSA